MAFKKKTVTCVGTDLVKTVDFGAAYGRVFKFKFLSDVDTSVSAAVVDAEAETVFTLVSGDYTAAGAQQLANFYVTPLEVQSRDTGGDLNADTEGVGTGVIAASPLTITAAGIDTTETLVVEVYYEV